MEFCDRFRDLYLNRDTTPRYFNLSHGLINYMELYQKPLLKVIESNNAMIVYDENVTRGAKYLKRRYEQKLKIVSIH